MTKIITVQNADGEPTTQAEIVIQNKIDYIPKVSVIIPVYNVEQYLRECLDSVINQTLKEIEIICIDDGSTDSSLEILKEYTKHDNRITILKQQNLRAGIARNAGLSVAKGEYLSFLDSDDFFELNMHEEMYNKAKENDVDIVMCNAYQYDDASKNLYKFNLKYDASVKQFLVTRDDLSQSLYDIGNSASWNKLYRKDFIKQNSLYFQNLSSCNDIGFDWCARSVARNIFILPDYFVYYRVFRKNSISSSRGEVAHNIILAYKYIKKFLENTNNQYLIWMLNNSIKRKIHYEVSNCTKEQFGKFRGLAQFYLNDDWTYFADTFKMRNSLYKLFGFIPFLEIEFFPNKKIYKLFGIKVLKINVNNNGFSLKTIFGIKLFSQESFNRFE